MVPPLQESCSQCLIRTREGYALPPLYLCFNKGTGCAHVRVSSLGIRPRRAAQGGGETSPAPGRHPGTWLQLNCWRLRGTPDSCPFKPQLLLYVLQALQNHLAPHCKGCVSIYSAGLKGFLGPGKWILTGFLFPCSMDLLQPVPLFSVTTLTEATKHSSGRRTQSFSFR